MTKTDNLDAKLQLAFQRLQAAQDNLENLHDELAKCGHAIDSWAMHVGDQSSVQAGREIWASLTPMQDALQKLAIVNRKFSSALDTFQDRS